MKKLNNNDLGKLSGGKIVEIKDEKIPLISSNIKEDKAKKAGENISKLHHLRPHKGPALYNGPFVINPLKPE